MKKVLSVRVRYGETDKMGIVHHSNYLRYLEMARIEWLRNLGMSYAKMELESVILPVVNTTLSFKSPSYFDDVLEVKIKLVKEPTSKLEFEYEIYNQDKKQVCTGTTCLAFLDANSMRPIRCPQNISVRLKEEL